MAINNILVCTTQVPFTTGGAEEHVAGLELALHRAGYTVETVAVPFKWYPPAQIMRGVLAWRMLDLTEANGKPVDLVIGMKFPAYLVEHPRKVLWIMHQHRSAYNLSGTAFDDLSTYPEGARVRDYIRHCDSQFIPAARKVFANSKTVAERLWRYNSIRSEPLYHPPPRPERLRTGESGDYIFYPSRLEPQKRQELLIEAMRYVNTEVRCVFAGSTRDIGYYRALADKAGVSSRVSFAGFTPEEELIDLYANALAVCYLPFDEDYGYVTLEAMLSGKAVIVPTDGGGATEFLQHEASGLIVEPEPEAIAAAIDGLYQDRARARRMGAQGRESALALRLSWDYVAERLVSAGG